MILSNKNPNKYPTHCREMRVPLVMEKNNNRRLRIHSVPYCFPIGRVCVCVSVTPGPRETTEGPCDVGYDDLASLMD